MEMNKPLLTITPLKPSEIPAEEALLREANELLESSLTWKEGKTYYGNVKTSSHPQGPHDGAPWHCRISEHSPKDITFDQLWDKLGKDKVNNEQQFIDELKKVAEIKVLSPTASIWTLYYNFTPLVSPRVFTELQVVHLDENAPRNGVIVSLPIDLSSKGDEELAKLEEKGVKGRYASVERIMELENGNIEWRMAVSSTPGGSIPKFIAESSMAKKVAHDVPSFLKFFRSLHQ